MTDLDFMDITADLLSEMRLLVEGAITLYEDDTTVLITPAAKAEKPEAHIALSDIGGALYELRRHMSQAFIQMSAVFAELELSIIRARVRSGMQNAKAKGKKIGRPRVTREDIPVKFLRHYPEYVSGNLNLSELARVSSPRKLGRKRNERYLEEIWYRF